MPDVRELLDHPPPRNEATCRRFLGLIEPLFAYVLLGVVYSAVAGFPGLVIVLAIVKLAPPNPPGWVVFATVALWPMTFGAMWIPYVRWVRRKRAAAARFFREAAWEDATFAAARHSTSKNGPATHVTARLDDGTTVGFSERGHLPLDRRYRIRALRIRGEPRVFVVHDALE